MSKCTDLKEVCADMHFCTECPLWFDRKQPVFGEGNVDAKMLFVGEVPGMDEDEQGRPFVGKAGKLLNSALEKVKLNRSKIYISNICHCRPPENRTPTWQEMQSCFHFLIEQIKIIQPLVVVSLGSTATKTLLNDTEIKITQIRGNLYDLKGAVECKLIPTLHPAYVLRNRTQENITFFVKDIWKAKKTAIEIMKGY